MTVMTKSALEDAFRRTRTDATALAGKPADLIQRASVYFHLYQDSGGNHAFPLLAAHGALWGSGHFSKGLKIGRALSLATIAQPDLRRQRLDALERFATAFKEINRQVCVETYTSYHMTRLYGERSDITEFVPADLADALNRCHHANRRRVPLNDAERMALFEVFFFWEQDNVVGPGVGAAVSQMDWSIIMWLAMKPAVGFAYFGTMRRLWFSDFASKQERIEKGLQAYALAEHAGWPSVVASLRSYNIMPSQFLRNPAQHFEDIRYAQSEGWFGDPSG